MHPHRSCPICRSEVLQRVLRDATFLADLGGEVNPLAGVMSYRCVNGHVFMILPSTAAEAATRPSNAIPLTRLRLQVTRS